MYMPACLAGQSGEAHIFPIQDDKLTAELPLRRSILQSTLRQKYRSPGKHNPQRDGGPEKGLYRLHLIALACLAHLIDNPGLFSAGRAVSRLGHRLQEIGAGLTFRILAARIG
jgi:hypothetical protein